MFLLLSAYLTFGASLGHSCDIPNPFEHTEVCNDHIGVPFICDRSKRLNSATAKCIESKCDELHFDSCNCARHPTTRCLNEKWKVGLMLIQSLSHIRECSTHNTTTAYAAVVRKLWSDEECETDILLLVTFAGDTQPFLSASYSDRISQNFRHFELKILHKIMANRDEPWVKRVSAVLEAISIIVGSGLGGKRPSTTTCTSFVNSHGVPLWAAVTFAGCFLVICASTAIGISLNHVKAPKHKSYNKGLQLARLRNRRDSHGNIINPEPMEYLDSHDFPKKKMGVLGLFTHRQKHKHRNRAKLNLHNYFV